MSTPFRRRRVVLLIALWGVGCMCTTAVGLSWMLVSIMMMCSGAILVSMVRWSTRPQSPIAVFTIIQGQPGAGRIRDFQWHPRPPQAPLPFYPGTAVAVSQEHPAWQVLGGSELTHFVKPATDMSLVLN